MRVLRSLSSMPVSAPRSLVEAAGCVDESSRAVLAHLLSEAPQVIGHFLAIVHHLVDFLGRKDFGQLAGGARGILLRHQIAHAICLLLLLSRQLVGGLRHRVEASGGVLLLEPPKRSVASRKRSAARRESAALALCEAARRMSSLA